MLSLVHSGNLRANQVSIKQTDTKLDKIWQKLNHKLTFYSAHLHQQILNPQKREIYVKTLEHKSTTDTTSTTYNTTYNPFHQNAFNISRGNRQTAK